MMSKVVNAIGWKVNQFTFPKKIEGEEAFYFDDVTTNRRFWFHITESAIPQGTALRLSETDATAWQEAALKHIKTKPKRVKEPGSAKGTRRVEDLI